MPNAAETAKTTGKFLTAEWRDVALLNYQVDPILLRCLRVRQLEQRILVEEKCSTPSTETMTFRRREE